MREVYGGHMEAHPLKREIIATQITNDMANRMGGTFWLRMQDASGHHPADIARAYTAAREIFAARALWQAIESLDNRVSSATQIDMFSETRRLLDRATLWLLRQHRTPLDIAAMLARYVEATTDTDIGRSAELHFKLNTALELHWLKEAVHALPRRDPWQRRARTGLLDDLQGALRMLTKSAIVSTGKIKSAEQRIHAWLEQHRVGVEPTRALFADVRATGRGELAMLSVAVREMRAFAQASIASAA